MMYPHMPYAPYIGAGWFIVMLVGMIIFWGLLITGLIVLIRYIAAHTPTRQPLQGAETPQDILKRRLAAGEISTEEYENIRLRLGGS